MKHLESNNILTDVQYGCRSKQSCEAQLFLTIDDLARAVDSKLQVDVTILDFAKALIISKKSQLTVDDSYNVIVYQKQHWTKH